jgi:hypothetical protein
MAERQDAKALKRQAIAASKVSRATRWECDRKSQGRAAHPTSPRADFRGFARG